MIPNHTFFVNPNSVVDNTFILDKNESHHLHQVLRLKPDTRVSLINGLGIGYVGTIKKVDDGIVYGLIEKEIKQLGENDYNINVIVAIIKRNRFENLLEKATELGVTIIQPIITDRCVKKTINFRRCKKIIMSSAKQCQRSQFPILHKPVKLFSWLKENHYSSFAGKMNSSNYLGDLKINKKIPANILIGPEGDFTRKEIDNMVEKDVMFYTLGKRRLRTETAVIKSISIINELLR